MEQPHAGGRTTQTPSRAETLLENGISEVIGEVASLMVLARAVDPAADEFGHRRSGVYSDAVNLLKTSARLGHTIAELRGSKFEHNINVRREQIDGRREKVVDSNANAREDEEESGEPDWEFRKYKGHDYDPSVRFKDGKFLYVAARASATFRTTGTRNAGRPACRSEARRGPPSRSLKVRMGTRRRGTPHQIPKVRMGTLKSRRPSAPGSGASR